MNLLQTLRDDLRVWTLRTQSRTPWWQLLALPLNPALTALGLLRLSQWAQGRRLGLLARCLSRLNWFLTRCDIRADAVIGPALFMPHPQGVILGRVTIGRNVILAARVIIGPRAPRGEEGAPRLGDNVTIFLNSSVLGTVSVGDDAVVAGHSMVTEDVPAACLVGGAPARVLRTLTTVEINERRPSRVRATGHIVDARPGTSLP